MSLAADLDLEEDVERIVGACSFAFMSSPKPVMEPGCNAGYEAPVTDTVIGAAAAALSGFEAIQYERGAATYPVFGMLPALVPMALLFSASATWGYFSRGDCERTRAR